MELPSKLPCRKNKGISDKIADVLFYRTKVKIQSTNPQLIATTMPDVQVFRRVEWHNAFLEPRSHIQEEYRGKNNTLS